MNPAEVLSRPLTIKGVTIRNRIMSTAHSSGFVQGGLPQEQYRLYHQAKARGGIGLTMIAGTSSVTPDSPNREAGHVDLSTDEAIPHFQKLAKVIRDEGASVFAQIGHMGRRAIWDRDNWLPIVSASTIREPTNHSFPKAAEDWDIRRIVAGFGQAALRCKQGDMQGVEVGGAYMHLVEQFLSPLSNDRTDAYGGSLENRSRFLIEILESIRLATGDDFVVGARLSGDELRKGGLDQKEAIILSRDLVERGLVDYLSIMGGEAQDHISHPTAMPGMSYPVAPFVYLAGAVKREVDVPIFHAQRISDVRTAARALSDGMADMIAMTRPHMADPYIVNKMMEGREDDIRPCIGANYCIDRFYIRGQARCLHNPAMGREAEIPYDFEAAPAKRRVVIVGAGPAGLEAARVCAHRGHDVVLFEKSDRTGGQVNIAAKAPRHEALANVTQWLDLQVRKLGVQVRLGVAADAATVAAENPDVVIVATGGRPGTAGVKGAEHAVSTWQVLNGQVELAENVLIYDDNGEHQAPMCAEFMAQRGVNVEFLTHDRAMGQDIGLTEAALYRKHLYGLGVLFTPDQKLIEIYPEDNRLVAVLRNAYTDAEEERVVDQIVIENGTLPVDGLYFDLKAGSRNLGEVDLQAFVDGRPQEVVRNRDGAFDLFRVGDAVTSRNIHGAIYEAVRLCKAL
ncbi:MAG: FAD-dependent oxidoreductase [Hyphomicrobiales bacterium]|nr:FAD-dependent oxidoreductase [Hyphomicrobiales bacterium]